MARMSYCHRDVLPFTAMVAVECATVGSNTLFKAASLKGMSFYVFVFYALMSQIAGYKGLEYSSPTLAAAISNLTPAFTFTLAVIFRMEQVMLSSSATQAKIIGTIVSISGALVVVLYKGPKVFPAASSTASISYIPHLDSSESNWIIGGLLIASQYLLISAWYIIQTRVMKIYPAEVTVVFFYNLCGTLMSAPVCLLAERDLSSWQLKSHVALTSVIYAGFFGSSLGTLIHTWGIHLKGPVYVSMFKPLAIVIAVIMGAIFLGDILHLGSVIGGLILSVGFYTVIWGKAKEDATKTGSDMSPLLQHNREDEVIIHRYD